MVEKSPAHHIQFVTRTTCGSCQRVREQIAPVVDKYVAAGSARFEEIVLDVLDTRPEWEMEFGDRVPVLLVDDEEIACWEVDNDELEAVLNTE